MAPLISAPLVLGGAIYVEGFPKDPLLVVEKYEWSGLLNNLESLSELLEAAPRAQAITSDEENLIDGLYGSHVAFGSELQTKKISKGKHARRCSVLKARL
ncbi:hypothetical protein HAX54_019743 [Datura stramonium]|uniref:Uncharacterized protein n=1 Tax=Datura stramonium TaxID=4076 RepID=A0ABS8URE9_DATST|nr:hypothetical protein [Datura stramonium]